MHALARLRRSPLLPALAVLALAVAACSPAETAPTPSPTPAPPPAATFTGGRAAANLTAPDPVAWKGGYCTRGADDAWLAINIGDLNGDEYFGLVVGADPHADPAASPAAGGGTFRGAAATITWRHGGARAVISRVSTIVVVAPDLRSGSFSGTLDDGREVRGGFDCP